MYKPWLLVQHFSTWEIMEYVGPHDHLYIKAKPLNMTRPIEIPKSMIAGQHISKDFLEQQVDILNMNRKEMKDAITAASHMYRRVEQEILDSLK